MPGSSAIVNNASSASHSATPHRAINFCARLGRAALLCALATSCVAQAATIFDKDNIQLELYGILDVGVGYLEHSYGASDVLASTINSYNLNGSPNSYFGLFSGGASMSRAGVRGEMHFDTGQKAYFRLETAITVISGQISNNGQAIYNNINKLTSANSASAINGQLFSRAAYLGFSDSMLGAVEVGRTINFSLDQTSAYDPLFASLLFSPLGYSGGIGGGEAATEKSRLDNSIKYYNTISGFSFGAAYQFKGDQSSQNAGYGWVAMAGYAIGGFSVEGVFSEMTNAVTWPVQYSNVVAPDPNVQVENTKGYMLTAKYTIDKATIKVGYEGITVWAPSNPNLDITHYYSLLPPNHSVNAAGQQYINLWWVGGDYKFTPKFDLAVGIYDIDTYNAPEVGKAYWATEYSLLADYTLSHGFDTYLGIMISDFSGVGLTKHHPNNAYSTNGMYGVGLRYRF
jgi:general bacterial porin, GBP family